LLKGTDCDRPPQEAQKASLNTAENACFTSLL